MVIRVLGILCVGVAHQSNKSTQLEITNAEALVTLVQLLRTSRMSIIQVGWLKGDLHGTTLSHATSLRRTYNTNCFV